MKHASAAHLYEALLILFHLDLHTEQMALHVWNSHIRLVYH